MSGLRSQELREHELQAVGTARTKAQGRIYNVGEGDTPRV